MQDHPLPHEIVAAVAEFLRAESHSGFQLRVAGNALDIARRQLELSPAADAAELARLTELLEHGGALADLNRELAQAIASGAMDFSTPGLAAHLWETTLAKLSVDQPTYSGYSAALRTLRQTHPSTSSG
ncbi:MAG TPA: DUF6285 domain-containing protein [Rhizomicrobium sp.]|nr:DUF6285 domain-containing protein [Rhizomicrobium sp.]